MKRKKVSSHIPGKPVRAFILIMGLIASAIHVYFFRTTGGEIAFAPILLGLLLAIDSFVLWWAFIFMAQSQVTLFEEGIELKRGGSKIFTSWDNVSRFGITGAGKNRRRGIYLHKKVSPKTRGFVEKIFWGRDTDFMAIGQCVNLPTTKLFSNEIDSDKVRETIFGQELYDLAPHLFEEYDDWKPKNRLEDGYADNRQSDWIEELQSEESKHG